MATVFPPHRLHSSQVVSSSHARTIIFAYLEAATADPSLHPDAVLTENGPIAPASGAATGLVLHNLKRIEAGLRGEYLAPDLEVEGFEADGLPNTELQKMGITSLSGPAQDRREVQETENLDMEWQDKDEYEREQEIIRGDVGNIKSTMDEEPEIMRRPTKVVKSISEKEARKRAKKERNQREKSDNAERRKREKQAES